MFSQGGNFVGENIIVFAYNGQIDQLNSSEIIEWVLSPGTPKSDLIVIMVKFSLWNWLCVSFILWDVWMEITA